MGGITMTARRAGRGVEIHTVAGRFAMAVAVAALVPGCADSGQGEGAMAEARALYQANCAACHGDDARGDGPMARTLPVEPPSVIEHLGHHTEAELIHFIRNGIPPAMPPTGLSDDESRQIIAYVWTLASEPEVAELRAMQAHMEAMAEQGAAQPMTPGMDHSQHMQSPTPEVDHSQHMQDTTPAADHSQHAPGPTSMTTPEPEPILASAEHLQTEAAR